MAEPNELQALDIITAEVDDAQIKVILATQCIKAQAFLVEKLKKQIKHNKETCGFISSANMKLQSEITQAEQEIKSFQISKETIKMANVELKKEVLLAKEKKLDVIERVQIGGKKYEGLWLECKSRYESLPYVQKLLKATGTAHSLKDQIAALDKKAESLAKGIKEKTEACLAVDREKIIQLAKFMVHERPQLIDKVNEKSKAITDLTNELKNNNINVVTEKIVEKEKTVVEQNTTATVDENQGVDESALIMPKLQLDSLDLDDLISIKLDQVKMKKGVYTTGLQRQDSFCKPYFDINKSIYNRKSDIEEYTSSYFHKPSVAIKDTKNYSRMKLINILEDVKIDENGAMDIISKVNPETLQPVESISAEGKSDDPGVSRNEVQEPMQTEEIEEIDMTSSNTENIVNPPTQFLDESLKTQKSQENKKTVTFDLPGTSQNESGSTNKSGAQETDVNETINKQLDVSADDGFTMIKDMVLKKHNLDLTPPFVYAKNTMLQMVTEEKIVKSKFFKDDNTKYETDADEKKKVEENNDEMDLDKFEHKTAPFIEKKDSSSEAVKIIEEHVTMVSSPKNQRIDDLPQIEKPFSGYLFRHGPHGLPESMDVSISTTGYEDGDTDFPHCIDSSLLLSPKADLPMCSGNSEVPSQDAPNFLSGLRKTGLSFFGRLPAGDSKPDSGAQTQGSGFNFNFGGEEKKNRGGLFSMFQ